MRIKVLMITAQHLQGTANLTITLIPVVIDPYNYADTAKGKGNPNPSQKHSLSLFGAQGGSVFLILLVKLSLHFFLRPAAGN